MAELGSDSREVQCLDNTVLTSPFTVFAKNARLQNKLPEMLGELAGLCWDVVLLCETRSALGTVRLDSGHLFIGSTPLSPAAGVGILFHERHVSNLKLVKQPFLRYEQAVKSDMDTEQPPLHAIPVRSMEFISV